MRFASWIIALTVFLAGCEVAPVVTGPVATASKAQASTPASLSAAARNFVRVLDQLEPVAERECRRRSPQLNCDFLIVVDDRPDQPPNAFQTVDDDGRPVIVFTESLILDMRNVDEIAFVMAHEAAHHIENHLAEQRRNASLGAAVFGQLAGATGGGEEAVRTAQELGASIGARTYSKDFELEADRPRHDYRRARGL